MIKGIDLSKRQAEQTALEGLSFTFEGKGIFGILGPRGAGKSALARLIAGIDVPDGGELVLGEAAPADPRTLLEWRRRVGVMPTELSAYGDMTLFEFLCFVGEAKGVEEERLFRQSTEALRLMDLSDYSACLIDRLHTYGKRKLGVAAALIGNPDTVILDEPTAGLDRTRADELRRVLFMLGAKKQILLFTRDPEEAEALCHTVLMLSKGRQVAYDTTEAFLQKLNRTETALLRVSLRGHTPEDACRVVCDDGGVRSCLCTGEEGSGCCRLQMEAEPAFDRRKSLDKRLNAEGMSLQSYDAVTLRLSDAFDVLTEPSEVAQAERRATSRKTRKGARR